jgi:hypothetical protein
MTHLLFPATRTPRPRGSLRRALVPKLRDVLARVCLWDDDGAVGDYRFCVFSYHPRPGVQVYLQFWSEPGDVVEWEVSSGNWHQPTKAYMQGRRSDAVRAMGFRVGGQARNFQRDVDIESEEDLDALAAAVFDVLYDALGYRGGKPLEVMAVADTAAPRRAVYETLTADYLIAILERAGFTCEEQASSRGMTPVLVVRGRLRATVLLTSGSSRRGYGAAAIGPAPKDFAQELFAPGNEVSPMVFTGGVTAEWIAAQVGVWFHEQRRARRALPVQMPVPRTAERVH